MAKELRQGDRVEWNTSQGPTRGRVVRKLTRPTKIEGFEVKASEDAPKHLVRSDKTGAHAAHAPEALRKLD